MLKVNLKQKSLMNIHSKKPHQKYGNKGQVQSHQINFLWEFRKVSQVCPLYNTYTFISTDFVSNLSSKKFFLVVCLFRLHNCVEWTMYISHRATNYLIPVHILHQLHKQKQHHAEVNNL